MTEPDLRLIAKRHGLRWSAALGAALADAYAAGKPLPRKGGPRPFKDTEAGRKLLERMQREHAAGASFQAIADGLQAEGVPTPRGRGEWTRGTVSYLLRLRD